MPNRTSKQQAAEAVSEAVREHALAGLLEIWRHAGAGAFGTAVSDLMRAVGAIIQHELGRDELLATLNRIEFSTAQIERRTPRPGHVCTQRNRTCDPTRGIRVLTHMRHRGVYLDLSDVPPANLLWSSLAIQSM